MKILMISDVYFPRVNGVSTSIATFRRELVAQGHEVHLIVPDYGRITEDEHNIHRIPSRNLILDPEDRMMKTGHVMAMREWLHQSDFDIVHIQTPFVAHYLGVRLAKELGVPRIESYHTFFEEYLYFYVPFLPKQFMRFMARRLSSHQCNNLDGMVVPSSAMLEALRNYGIETRAKVIPTGLDPKSFEPGDGAAFRQRHAIAAQRPVMLYVGRVAFEKNIGFLIKVLVRVRLDIPDVLLVVAGEGPALSSLKQDVDKLSLSSNVLFVGYLDRRRELPGCYRSADVFVFSSHTETQGLVLLEAMAQGVPLVSLAEMGAKDVLKPGQGVLIADNDIEDFSTKSVRLLRDKEYASSLGAIGRSYAATWSAAVLAQRLAGFYQAMIERHAEVPTASLDPQHN
ncbi:glycosyl transferase family 1 [Sulfuricella sp. T08]|uniref:glycosyltransferase n=1 Tax=Sulfuricella sp. T08 TaxID=1632857 RepID=UPI0006179C66|nr:glycosyltransferase [Sulfuricella sp. T08]GAO36760.1 glycosyl transferase family 1 [Sulfuricella sp. T08]